MDQQVEQMTPMMRQYFDLKEKCQDYVLFFRMGDFYEIFGDDAEDIAPKLEIVLTSRERGDQKRIPFCGVPHHSAKNYWLKLIKLGYKVAIADQLEDASVAKGIVKRDITRFLTPGSIDDLEGLDKQLPNYLMAVFEHPQKQLWVCVVADVSTGELRVGNLSRVDEITQVVERFRPKELLARKFFHAQLKGLLHHYLHHEALLIEPLPEAPLRDEQEQKNILKTIFGTEQLVSQPCGDVIGGRELVTATLTYLQQLNVSLSQFICARPLNEPGSMVLDDIATRDLELFETAKRRQTEGSLFKQINKCLSPMGARLLRFRLAHPFIDVEKINSIRSCVTTFLSRLSALNDLREQLKLTSDLERLVTRVLSGSAQPQELGQIRTNLTIALALRNMLCQFENVKSPLLVSITNDLALAETTGKYLDSALIDHPVSLGTGYGVFKDGFDAELDSYNELSLKGQDKVSQYEGHLRQQTGINSLKIKHHKNFGLLIEITKTNLAKVPESFIRRQTMVNCERYVTMELKDLDENLSGAVEKAILKEAELHRQFLMQLSHFKVQLKNIAQMMAELDVIQALAWQAYHGQYNPADISKNGELILKASRHPVVEHFVGRHVFIANDLSIVPSKRHVVITGPNMAGKSTVMRQAAICAILNQIGSYIPAKSATLPIFDRIFTRVGASDDLSKGQSTFMVEMTEAANILRAATASSLVILDEVGRGTSTQDGLALAGAILEELANNKNCYTLFATHFHELVDFAKSFTNIETMQTEVLETQSGIVFTHRLIQGAASKSFGIEVAKLAGLPKRVIERANKLLMQNTVPDNQVKCASMQTLPPVAADITPLETLGLKVEDNELSLSQRAKEIIDRLEGLKIHKTTPLQALNFLNDLKDLLKKSAQQSLF